jgi:hypothetical protein
MGKPTTAERLAYIILTGANLIEVKERIGHGRFIAWVQSECPFSYRSAHRYMRIASLFSKSDTVADLAGTGTERSNNHER